MQTRSVQLWDMPVATDAHLGECDELAACSNGFIGKVNDPRQIVGFVVCPVLKLDGRNLERHGVAPDALARFDHAGFVS